MKRRILVVTLAALMMLSTLGSFAALAEEPAQLRYIFFGDMTSRRDEFFKNEFHDAVLKELNIDITMETLPWGSNSTLGTMVASGEKFACNYIVSAFDWAQKGYMSTISMDLINELMPNYLAMRGESNGFECVKVNGEIVCIPFGCDAYAGAMQMMCIREDILNEVGYSAKDIHTIDELEEAIEAVKEAYPDMRVIKGIAEMVTEFMSLFGDQLINYNGDYGFVDELEDTDTVYSYFESETFQNLCHFTRDWALKGWIPMDVVTDSTQMNMDWEAGNCLINYGSPNMYVQRQLTSVPGAKTKLIRINTFPKLKTKDYDWGIAITAADAENVPNWLRLFDWMYASQENYDFCVFGVEGKDWERADDGTIRKLVSDSFIDDWFMQASCYLTYPAGIDQEDIDAYINNDSDSLMSKRVGFNFDPSPVATENALIKAVVDEFVDPLRYGQVDFEGNYDNLITKLYEAGLEDYLEEYQNQFSEWYAAKNAK